MKKTVLLSVALATWLVAGSAQATSYPVFAYDETKHAVWIPGLDERHLLLDDGATLAVEPDQWTLRGNLTSADNGSQWTLSVIFTGVLTGSEFGALTGFDDARIKGASWSDYHPDWAFAEFVGGSLVAVTGAHAGREFSLERNPGSGDYYAQFGTCMNDKNCDKGMATWVTITDIDTQETYRGDINVSVGEPVPEPTAGLVFGAGLFVMGSAVRRRIA